MRRPAAIVLALACLAAIWVLRPAVSRLVGGAGTAPVATHAPGVLIIDLADGASTADIEAFEKRYGVDVDYVSPVSEDEALVRAKVADPAALIERLRGDPMVEAAEPSVQMKALGYPNDPMYPQQWSMRMVGAPIGWRVGGGRGVKVAVVDTGITRVEDLEGITFGTGRSFVPDVKTPADDNGHGTHVAGTIAQATHNGKGVTGVAPNATLMAYKVLSANGGGSSEGVAAAIDDAADAGADIINLSLGGPYSKVIEIAVQKATAQGVLVVAAAGNSGDRGVHCPGCLEDSIGVSAVGPDDKRAPYSTYGKGVEIAAPGGNKQIEGGGILQDTITPGVEGGHAYQSFQGTSMATPHVAGALAVLRGLGLSPQAARDTLFASAAEAGGKGWDEVYGYGRLDVEASVKRALSRRNGVRFGIAGLLALALVMLIGVRTSQGIAMVGTAAVAGGGLFFLAWLPVPIGFLSELAMRDLVAWPAVLIGPDWAHFPLWASAAVPLASAFSLGLIHRLAPWVAGMCIGFGVSLLHAAPARTLDPWWLSGWLDAAWLGANGVVCLGAAVAIVGAMKLTEEDPSWKR